MASTVYCGGVSLCGDWREVVFKFFFFLAVLAHVSGLVRWGEEKYVLSNIRYVCSTENFAYQCGLAPVRVYIPTLLVYNITTCVPWTKIDRGFDSFFKRGVF